jgi:hypothetical protein
MNRMDSQGPTPRLVTEDHPDYPFAPRPFTPAPDMLNPAAARRVTFSSIRNHYVQAGTWRPANRLRDEILRQRYGP